MRIGLLLLAAMSACVTLICGYVLWRVYDEAVTTGDELGSPGAVLFVAAIGLLALAVTSVLHGLSRAIAAKERSARAAKATVSTAPRQPPIDDLASEPVAVWKLTLERGGERVTRRVVAPTEQDARARATERGYRVLAVSRG